MKAELMRALFDYDAEAGRLVWRDGRRRGKVAGWRERDGYRRIEIDGRAAREHHAVWAWHGMGEIPGGMMLDHANGRADDNRIENLRVCTMPQNIANAKRYRNNSSGFKGVVCRDGRYEAQIWSDGKPRYLGRFDTAEEAHAAYMRAAQERFGAFARAA